MDMEHTNVVTTWLKNITDCKDWQSDKWADRETDKDRQVGMYMGMFNKVLVIVCYYLLGKEGIKPPSRQVEEFSLKEE